MTTSLRNRHQHILVVFGLILLLLGLLVGFAIPSFVNPRMGLAAHLQGIMNGMLLIIISFLWPLLSLSLFWTRLTFWSLLYGTFANLSAVIISAVTGAGAMMPIAGGMETNTFVEPLISMLLISLSLAMVLALILIMTGYLRFIRSQTIST